MSYVERRKKQVEASVNGDRWDFERETTDLPLLHSGLVERTTKDSNKGVLALHFYFANGSYRCRIQDRENSEQAFLDLGQLVGSFEKINEALGGDLLDWQPMKPQNGDRWAR